MRKVSILIAVVVMAMMQATADADHFARQRLEASRARAAHHAHHGQGHGHGHWGGPTTHTRWYPSHGSFRDVRFVPVYPIGYGYPGYGWWNPYYGAPAQHIYIHRKIIVRR